MQHAEVEFVGNSARNSFILEDHITQTWIPVKHQFPPLGARVDERGRDVVFRVTENRLQATAPGDTIFRRVANHEPALAFLDDHLQSGQLSNNLLSQLLILQETSRSKLPLYCASYSTLHHRRYGSFGFRQAFLKRMSSPDPSTAWELTKRLALAVALKDLVPTIDKFNAARRRWRKFIGRTLASIRMRQKVNHRSL